MIIIMIMVIIAMRLVYCIEIAVILASIAEGIINMIKIIVSFSLVEDTRARNSNRNLSMGLSDAIRGADVVDFIALFDIMILNEMYCSCLDFDRE